MESIGKRKRASVVVLGDLGRSPRMQYHALSLADQAGLEVDVVAYSGTDAHAAVLNHSRIHLHLMSAPFTKNWPRWLYLVSMPIKIFLQLAKLIWLLCISIPSPNFFLVQNPPSIPTLMVLRWACWIKKSALIIDWHNFGYTLLGLNLGQGHPLVRIHHWYEKYFGRKGDAHLCVTRAMQHELEQGWGIRATLLYDRAPKFFSPATSPEKQKLLRKLGATITDFSSDIYQENQRPALVVSSTSWTPDEDFSILLEAAVRYDHYVAGLVSLGQQHEEKLPLSLPRLHIVVTGKGPLREFYEERIEKLQLRHVAIHTMWLTAEDYPVLLGSADLGVCLHTSSSGLDLPMKVVDMFGCGLPVCAISYSCIGELVQDHKNGLLFSSAEELSQQLVELFSNFPSQRSSLLDGLREGARRSGSTRWAEEWQQHVLPMISRGT